MLGGLPLTEAALRRRQQRGRPAIISQMILASCWQAEAETVDASSGAVSPTVIKKAVEIFETMRSAGVVPNVVTFNKAGDGMQEIFETGRTADVVPNVVMFNKMGDGMQGIFETSRTADVVPTW